MSRIFTTSFASVYPHYVTKVEKRGRTKTELSHLEVVGLPHQEGQRLTQSFGSTTASGLGIA